MMGTSAFCSFTIVVFLMQTAAAMRENCFEIKYGHVSVGPLLHNATLPSLAECAAACCNHIACAAANYEHNR